MRTMTLAEMGLSSGAVSLAGLFEGRFEPRLVQQPLAPIADVICKGGWPALVGRDVQSAEYLDAYFDALFSVSIPRRRLSGQESRRVALSLARNLGTAAKLSIVASDAGLGEADSKSATNRAAAHIAALQDLYVVEQLTGWEAPIRSKTRLRTKPKRYFADPSLAASLLQVSPERLLEDGQLLGLFFESLCMHDLAVYASALPGATADPLHYYRDSDGLEVHAVIELRDGRWAALEVKLGEGQAGAAAASLNRLARKVAANPMARNPSPEFLAVVVGAGEYARYDRDLGIYILPITCLGV
jgi:predicted AAA+ superfamily ATPase